MDIYMIIALVHAVIGCVLCVKLAAQKNKNKTTAGIVGFLFGILGILYYGFSEKEAPKKDDEISNNGKLPSTCINMLVVLTLISVVAGCVLAYVNSVTAPQIEKINADNLAAGIKAVMGSDDILVSEPNNDIDGYTIYNVYTSGENLSTLGTAVVTTNKNGFGGPLKVLVGFDTEGTILGYTLLEHAETPGLGAKAGDWFQKDGKGNIIGMNPGKNNFTVSKDGGDVDAITASTITSRAFLEAIKNAYEVKDKVPHDGVSGATPQATN